MTVSSLIEYWTDALGGIDPKTKLHLKDLIRDILLEDKLDKPALPGGRLEWPVSDRAKHFGYSGVHFGSVHLQSSRAC
ncbi:MAG: hypothetical protein AAF215_05685 [Cyanobacteria bacterium P01_A01_bin.123]